MQTPIVFVSWIGVNNDPYTDPRKMAGADVRKPGVILETLEHIKEWVAHPNIGIEAAEVAAVCLLDLVDKRSRGQSDSVPKAQRMLDAIANHLPHIRDVCRVIPVEVGGYTHTPINLMHAVFRELWQVHRDHPESTIVVSTASGMPMMAQAWTLLASHGLLPAGTRVLYKFEGGKGFETQAGLPEGQLVNPICTDWGAAICELRASIPSSLRRESELWNWEVARSGAARKVRDELHTLLRSRRPILLRGPRGAGKSHLAKLCAKMLAAMRGISDVPFEHESCAALLNGSLFQDMMFGHKKGAYTGANRDVQGLFAKANKGILFLDEIHDLDSSAQRQLMVALQERSFTPLGSRTSVATDFVLIVASNAEDLDLNLAPDFLDRVANTTVFIPPLKDLVEDFESIWRTVWFNELSEFATLPEDGASLLAWTESVDGFHARVAEAIKQEAICGKGLVGNWRDVEKLAARLLRTLPVRTVEQTSDNLNRALEQAIDEWQDALAWSPTDGRAPQSQDVIPSVEILVEFVRGLRQASQPPMELISALQRQIAKNVVLACEQLGMSRSEIANFLGVCAKTVAGYRKDERTEPFF